MTSFNMLRTDTWILSLPTDWQQGRQADGGSLYFESADGTKGIYVTTWKLADEDTRQAEDVVEAFQVADLSALKQMAGYRWQLLAQNSRNVDTASVGFIDLLAAEKCYRTVGKIIASPPVVVRAAFHDYACSDYDGSLQYFAPIIDSLFLYKSNAGTAS